MITPSYQKADPGAKYPGLLEETLTQKAMATQKGFSLLETLVAVTVLGISLLGLAQLLGIAIQQNDLVRLNTMSIEVARGKLEELKSAYNIQVASGTPASSLTDGAHGPETVYLPPGNQYFGLRTLKLGWKVSSVSTIRKDIEIIVQPALVQQDPEGGTGNSVYREIRINASLVP
jgi:prepilin-type N-terminal cleavage/methylation domain-containing protein